MRGNIFGGLGSRLGTQIHAGTFHVSRRVDTLFGQNVGAAILLSLSISAALAVLAKAVSAAFFNTPTISVVDFMVISVIGAIISSVVVLVITVAVAAFCATLPSLFLATYLIGFRFVSPTIAVLCAAVAVGALVVALRSKLPILRRIVLESLPVLVLAGIVDLLAGVTIEHRLESFLAFPALLVLVPAFLEDSGSLGAILAARISTKLHLGTLEPGRGAWRAAIDDVLLIYMYAIPVFVFLGASSIVVAGVAHKVSPGAFDMMGVALLAGFMATTAAVIVGYYAAVATYRFGLDPDNYGVPMVTSSLDLLGALSLILAIVIMGLG
jgi:mgtE-like transporter